MHEDAGSFDVPEEFVSESDSLVRAFDESGDVDHDEGVSAMFDHSERWFEGGEGVVGDFGPGGGDDGDEAGFSGVGRADYADVGEEFEFEAEGEFFAGFSSLGEYGEAVGGRGVVGVSGSAASALGGEECLAGFVEVNEKAGRGVFGPDLGADGDGESEVLAVFAVAQPALAAASVGGGEVALVSEGEQGVDVGVGLEVDVSSPASVASVGASARDVFFAASAYRAVSAVSAFYVDNYFVNHSVSISNSSNNVVDCGDGWGSFQ